MKILIMGLPGAGKTTLAEQLQKKLKCVWFNADEIRNHINRDLGFSEDDRYEQATRMGRLCDIVLRADRDVIADFVCPTDDTRRAFNADFTIWMNTIDQGRYADTNRVFQDPTFAQIIITSWDYDINHIVKLIRQYEDH